MPPSDYLSRRTFLGAAAAGAGAAATGGLTACTSAPTGLSALDSLASSLTGTLLLPSNPDFAAVDPSV